MAHLALFVDLICSALLIYTDDQRVYVGRSRDERLRALYREYCEWCQESGATAASNKFLSAYVLLFLQKIVPPSTICPGIPHGSRAKGTLFTTGTLQPKLTAYPSAGQRKINAGASSFFMHFLALIAARIAAEHPRDVHTCPGPK